MNEIKLFLFLAQIEWIRQHIKNGINLLYFDFFLLFRLEVALFVYVWKSEISRENFHDILCSFFQGSIFDEARKCSIKIQPFHFLLLFNFKVFAKNKKDYFTILRITKNDAKIPNITWTNIFGNIFIFFKRFRYFEWYIFFLQNVQS